MVRSPLLGSIGSTVVARQGELPGTGKCTESFIAGPVRTRYLTDLLERQQMLDQIVTELLARASS